MLHEVWQAIFLPLKILKNRKEENVKLQKEDKGIGKIVVI